jgi:cyclic pyranopterin monophosphate synthase
MSDLTHFDSHGASRMVDVSTKPETERVATASAFIRMKAETLTLIRDKSLSKGDVLEVARLAGIMGAKKTSELIPLCHPLALTSVKIDFVFLDETCLEIDVTAKIIARTGVEMEALTGASIAALTVYDMCKAVDREIVIERIQLETKSGGKSGNYQRTETP